MKLWQKIFILTLALVIVVVNATSLILINNNHRLAIERERQSAVSRHSYIIAELQNTIVYEQLIQRTISLDEDAVVDAARSVLVNQLSDTTMSTALYRDTVRVYPAGLGAPLHEEAMLEEPDYASRIIEAATGTYLLMSSSTSLNGTSYHLVSSFDITPAYTLFEAQLDLVRLVGIFSALVIAGLLLLFVTGLLAPLRSLSATTRQIAQGDLDKRAPVRGNDEVAEVARNLNTMADSIEHNVTVLENLAESRKVFIANLAHEMKTPLTSILGFADILRVKREVSDEDRVEFAGVVVSETKRLQGLSGKLMELLAVGNMQLTLEDLDLHELADELAVTLQPLFDRQQVQFVRALEDVRIHADRELIKSLVYNLIDNGIKASMPGSTITLTATAANGTVAVTVADEGMGIPADQIPLLTEPFYMLDRARTRKAGGAGLGLALCAEIAQAHNATLEIESELGVGTRVSVKFPEEPQAVDHGR